MIRKKRSILILIIIYKYLLTQVQIMCNRRTRSFELNNKREIELKTDAYFFNKTIFNKRLDF